VDAADKCPVEVRDALSCQQEADDFLLCSNIAAESCAPLYRTMALCREGKAEPKPWGQKEQAAETGGAPAGFERKTVSAHGFSQLMPSGAKLKAPSGKEFQLKGSDSGVTYLAKSVEVVGGAGEPDAKNILRTATKYLGNECQPKLRLHGRFETAGVIHVRFDTVCEDGTTYHGMFHFWEGKAIVATTVLESDTGEANPNLDSFLFGFEKTE
jgi:hypothetical protein